MQMKKQKQRKTGYTSPEFQVQFFSCESGLCTSQQAESIEDMAVLDPYQW